MSIFNQIVLVVLVCSAFSISSNGQSFSPATLASSGSVSEGKSVNLEWTIGEVFTQTAKIENGMFTQGSQQPYLQVEIIQDELLVSNASKTQISVFPNPVHEKLFIEIKTEEKKDIHFSLYDLSGRKILQSNIDPEAGNTELDLSSYKAGAYLLQFRSEDASILQSFKFIKASY